MDFIYDENGAPLGLDYTEDNETKRYYYVKNLEGDIVKIINNQGEEVVEYIYDGWGVPTVNILSTNEMDAKVGQENPFRFKGYYYDVESGLYYLQSRYYDPVVGRFVNVDGALAGVSDTVRGYNLFVYCFNNPIQMSDSTGNWPKWVENTVKVISVVAVVAAAVAVVTTISAFTAGTGSVAAVYGASIFLGAALSGINGALANEYKGNSYVNGYVGGAIGGGIQAACSKNAVGTILGGGAGVTIGTTVTDVMNNIDPDSSNSSAQEIVINATVSGGKALATSSMTAFMGGAVGGIDYKKGQLFGAVSNQAMGLMPELTPEFGEGIKAFFGWLDDAIVYIWE